jgi:hypothetical protein
MATQPLFANKCMILLNFKLLIWRLSGDTEG